MSSEPLSVVDGSQQTMDLNDDEIKCLLNALAQENPMIVNAQWWSDFYGVMSPLLDVSSQVALIVSSGFRMVHAHPYAAWSLAAFTVMGYASRKTAQYKKHNDACIKQYKAHLLLHYFQSSQ